MELQEELLSKLEEWLEKSKEKNTPEGKSVYNFAKIKEEVHKFLIEKVLPLPKEEMEQLLREVYESITSENTQLLFSSLLRDLFNLNPHLYPFKTLWPMSKSLITQNLEDLLESSFNDTFSLTEEKGISGFKFSPFSFFILSSPRMLQEENTLFLEPLFFKLTKNSYVAEIIFDYLSHLSPQSFTSVIFTEANGEITLNLKGIQKLCRTIVSIWESETEGKKARLFSLSRKLRKLFPIILNFVKTKKDVIDKIATAEAITFLERKIWNSEISYSIAKNVIRENFLENKEKPFENEDTLDFVSEVFLKGLNFLDLEDVVTTYDSDAIYEGLSFLLSVFVNNEKDTFKLLDTASDLSLYPYISKDYNYLHMTRFLIASFSPLIPEKFSEEILSLLTESDPTRAVSKFLDIVLSLPEKKVPALILLIPNLFKLGMYREVIKASETVEEKFIKDTEAEIIIAMSKFFTGEWNKEETVNFLRSKEAILDPFLGGELDNLIKLIKGEQVKDVKDPLALLYYYPYSEELYKEADIIFDYKVKGAAR